jgi:uncharacterized membrane protein (UPF0127 family)
MSIRMIRKSDQQVIATRLEVADSFLLRMRGLIGRKVLHAGEGMLFPRCNSIHMWCMSIPIDVVFLRRNEAEWIIVKLCRSLRPWKLLPVGSFPADDTLELPEGSIEKSDLKIGEVLCIAS